MKTNGEPQKIRISLSACELVAHVRNMVADLPDLRDAELQETAALIDEYLLQVCQQTAHSQLTRKTQRQLDQIVKIEQKYSRFTPAQKIEKAKTFGICRTRYYELLRIGRRLGVLPAVRVESRTGFDLVSDDEL